MPFCLSIWSFPYIFPSLPASRERRLPLPKVADRLFSFGTAGAVSATVFFVVMLFFARPGFNVNLSAMNTVSQATRAAEEKLTSVWGEIFSKVFLMTEADSIAALQINNDRLLARLEAEPDAALLSQAFLPSMIFPGSERSAANLAAWKSFWTMPRVAELKQTLPAAGEQAGLTPQAFEPFFALLTHPEERLPAPGIPELFRALVGVSEGHGAGQWRQFASLTLPPEQAGNGFYERYHDMAKIFDPALFSKQLGHLMFSAFLQAADHCRGGGGHLVIYFLPGFWLDPYRPDAGRVCLGLFVGDTDTPWAPTGCPRIDTGGRRAGHGH